MGRTDLAPAADWKSGLITTTVSRSHRPLPAARPSSGPSRIATRPGTVGDNATLNSDNYQIFLKEWFGKHWVYHLRPLINSIKLPEFYPVEEACESLKAV